MRASSRVKEEISAPSFSIFSGAATAATGRTWEERENQDCHSASRKRAVRVYACERLSEREREREVATIENGDIRRSEGLGNTGLLL